jgi:hypothetical protein
MEDSKITDPSDNTVSTLRGLAPLVRKSSKPEAESANNHAPPKRVAAGPTDLKLVRRREHNNVR